MMFSWCFSGLLTSFRDFLADESGYVQPREGLGLGCAGHGAQAETGRPLRP